MTLGSSEGDDARPAAFVVPAYAKELGGNAAWQALFAPAGTPKDVLETLREAMTEAMKAPSVVNTFQQQDFNIVPTRSLDEAKTWLAGEIDSWRKITQEVKIEIPE
jgi:tripartite-type tricarboxylate transporter receptor subunit TctC